MSSVVLKWLLLGQIGIDITLAIVFVFALRKFVYFQRENLLETATDKVGPFLTEAKRVAGQFRLQLKEKHRLVKSLNEELDRRIASLNVLLNRADVLLSSGIGSERPSASGNLIPSNSQQSQIIGLAKQGRNAKEIAKMLSLPRGEVELVLELKRKFIRLRKQR
ncbi:MAG: hypothetical protein JRI96_00465 [Deltaproteobacteria bacterium]|nr:hypothetical protein [Deltaproteobacteria bacterium]